MLQTSRYWRAVVVAIPVPNTSAIAELHLAPYSIVMATGIVSVAAQLRGFHAIALSLLWQIVGG